MSSYASLNAGMLARKGEAKPSAEPQLAQVLRTPTYRAPQPHNFTVHADPIGDAEAAEDIPASSGNAKVKIDDAMSAMWPAKKPPRSSVEVDAWRLDQRLGLPPSPRHTERTSVRFTHAQARALKLAALLLDRPQQELIEAGVEGKLEALACTDLASCTCFKAVLASIAEK